MTTAALTGPDEGLAPGVARRRWAAAIVMMAAALIDLIDATIVNVALPTIQHDLGADATSLAWWSRPTCWPSPPP